MDDLQPFMPMARIAFAAFTKHLNHGVEMDFTAISPEQQRAWAAALKEVVMQLADATRKLMEFLTLAQQNPDVMQKFLKACEEL